MTDFGAVFMRAYDLTGDEMYFERAFRPIATLMSDYPGWALLANGAMFCQFTTALRLSCD